jgi:hypothetical protein
MALSELLFDHNDSQSNTKNQSVHLSIKSGRRHTINPQTVSMLGQRAESKRAGDEEASNVSIALCSDLSHSMYIWTDPTRGDQRDHASTIRSETIPKRSFGPPQPHASRLFDFDFGLYREQATLYQLITATKRLCSSQKQ